MSIKNQNIIVFLLFLLISLAITFLRNNFLYTTIVDDSYIFFRYAENIFNGFGFVWNIGEKPVEGYSSFGYLAVLLAGKFLSINPEYFSLIMGIISSALSLYFIYLLYNLLNPDLRYENLFVIFLISFSPAYGYWAGAGMETSFYFMSLSGSAYFYFKFYQNKKNIFISGILFGLLCLIRFEGVLFFLLFFLHTTWNKNKRFKFRLNIKSFLILSGFIVVFGSYFIWRWIYFGNFFPNTFYAKTGGGIDQLIGGFKYVYLSFRRFYGVGWILILPLFFFIQIKYLSTETKFLFFISIISVFSTILIGGDHFHNGRFIYPILPLLFIILPYGFNSLFNLLKKYNLNRAHVATIYFLTIIVVMIFKPIYIESFDGLRNLFLGKKDIVIRFDESVNSNIVEWQHAFILMGKELNKIAEDEDVVACVPIGAIGYFSKISVIDMVGLVDPVIANEIFEGDKSFEWTPGHTKGDGKYVLSRKPKFIQLTDYLTKKPLSVPQERSFMFKSIREIWASEDFHNQYEFYPIEVIDGWYYNLYKRKDANLAN